MELPESIQAYLTDESVPAPDAAMLEACEKAGFGVVARAYCVLLKNNEIMCGIAESLQEASQGLVVQIEDVLEDLGVGGGG